jgi:hypothetical protein
MYGMNNFLIMDGWEASKEAHCPTKPMYQKSSEGDQAEFRGRGEKGKNFFCPS